MKAKFSPLELLEFELLESTYTFNIPKEEEIDLISLFKSYRVDIDFNHHELEDNRIQLFVFIEVNQLKKPKAGYSLTAHGVGLFDVDDSSELDESMLGNLKYYSTLNMIINNLRNVMYQISNLGPMDGYLLPAIDILDLFKKKRKKK